ncbi:hypothetical protein Pcinc_017836 [Petrolisthes cinctipes]|uniref:C3H1-type domain-containing protein n=1 Tax=Petrolisthes cinctipes TaxID=88211 RepID=A0AAE1FNH5_PETCI|nr:hypothetical protein Pcinc_017836 [Petrolisthes cinctipes]
MCKSCVVSKAGDQYAELRDEILVAITSNNETAVPSSGPAVAASSNTMGVPNVSISADDETALDGAIGRVDDSDGAMETEVNIVNMTGENRKSGDIDVTARKTAVCRFYLRKLCKHGRDGDGCAFSHPKMCYRFINYGLNSTRGCSKRNQCSFYHPPLCWEAEKSGYCGRKNCRFYHIRGTTLLATETTTPSVFNHQNSEAAAAGKTESERHGKQMPDGFNPSSQRSGMNYAARQVSRSFESQHGGCPRGREFTPNGEFRGTTERVLEEDRRTFLDFQCQMQAQMQQMQQQIQKLLNKDTVNVCTAPKVKQCGCVRDRPDINA